MESNWKQRLLWGINIVLGICAVGICIMKFQLQENTIVEANYIGDVESENRKRTKEKEGKEIEEPKNVTTGELTDQSRVRVLIETTDFDSIYHDKISVSAKGGLQLIYKIDEKECKHIVQDNKKLEIDASCSYIQDGSVRITPCKEGEWITVCNIERGHGNPAYENALEIYKEDKKIVLVNEIKVDQYLRGVLPSEMPSSYEEEALKAQAVAARSYAYMHLKEYAYPEYKAHVNDSTDFQVFNNTSQNKSSNKAVESTRDEKVMLRDEIATTYFFSTSCGHTTDVNAWGEKVSDKTSHLQGKVIAKESGTDKYQYYEEDMPWFKWSVVLSKVELKEILENNLNKKIGTIKNIEIVEKGVGGIVTALEVEGSQQKVVIKTEYDIREALGSTQYHILRQDGSKVRGRTLLPSAFFDITVKDEVVISGGGFGHGIGMSQTGANEMAKTGMGYKQILQVFYTGIEVKA